MAMAGRSPAPAAAAYTRTYPPEARPNRPAWTRSLGPGSRARRRRHLLARPCPTIRSSGRPRCDVVVRPLLTVGAVGPQVVPGLIAAVLRRRLVPPRVAPPVVGHGFRQVGVPLRGVRLRVQFGLVPQHRQPFLILRPAVE